MEIKGSRDGEIFFYSVSGRFDAQTFGQVEEQLKAWLDGGESRLVGDFTNLEYISSAGLRVLLKITKNLAEKGGRMALCGLKDHIKQVFEITGFSKIIPIAESQPEAMKVVVS